MEDGYIGFVKYEGELVEDGLMDARRQAKALLAIDLALRYFIEKNVPELGRLDFEIPIRIRKGSWEALIPETVGGWAQGGLGVVATAYFTKAAQKMAEKDFADFGILDIFKSAINAMKWFARIGKHMGNVKIRVFSESKISLDQKMIGVKNEAGKILYVPKEILDLYVQTNPKILSELAENITQGRELLIGTIQKGIVDQEVIGVVDKELFFQKDVFEEEDVLFPELVHGDSVILEGEVTRENKTTNSMGFKYREHILSAYPLDGSIVRYKPDLFLRCKLFGVVDRKDEKGRIAAKKPRLFFFELYPLEDDATTQKLL